MRQFNRVTIIGVGLIGGSIGLAIKKRRLAGEVVGVFRRRSTLNKAIKRGAIDRGVMSIEEGVKGADLIILATPVSLIPQMAAKAAIFARDALITDAGSTKRWVVEKTENLLGRLHQQRFVGSHPMAGSEQKSVEFAVDDLMDGSPCIVTRTPRTDKEALKKVMKFWKTLGAKVSVMSPESHDKRAAFISHLPHMVAFSLAGTMPTRDLIYAAEGFKDTTRVASSDPSLWADIFVSNKKELIKAGRVFLNYYNSIVKALSKDDYRLLLNIMNAAKRKRDRFVYAKKS